MAKSKAPVITSHMSVLPLQILIFSAPFILGLYFEWASALATLYLMVFLALCMKKNKLLYFPKSPTLIALAVMLFFFAVNSLWAVDRGMAVFGFVKFLPLPLFALSMAQVEEAERGKLLEAVPLSGVCMTVISYILSLIPSLTEFFTVNHRLAGFMQYPNTFGLLLLLGVACIVLREELNIKSILMAAVLFFGIAATGSRTTFLLLILCVIAFLFLLKNKKLKLAVSALLITLIAGTAIYAAVTGNLASIGRYLTTSLSSSTFVGRALYYKDSLPVILSHPFGLGYLGYYFSQGSFQTGVYSLYSIHNELLQLLLDVGWIPAGFFVWAILRSLRGFKNNLAGCFAVCIICLHSMMDFDMQYIAMGFILIAAMGLNSKTQKCVSAKAPAAVCGAVLLAVSTYFGIASGVYYFNNFSKALDIYPSYTSAMIQLMPRAQTAAEMDSLANDILRLNKSVTIAHSAKARVAYSQGDVAKMVKYKETAISLAKYSLEEYLDYFNMLATCYQMYAQAGDTEGARFCRDKILQIPDMISEVLDSTSPLAWKITDKPQLELPDEYLTIINDLK